MGIDRRSAPPSARVSPDLRQGDHVSAPLEAAHSSVDPEDQIGVVAWLRRHGFAAWYDWFAWPVRAQRESLWVLVGVLSGMPIVGVALAIAIWPNPVERSAVARDALGANQAQTALLRAEVKRLSTQMGGLAPAQSTADVRAKLVAAMGRGGVVEATVRLKSEVDVGEWHGRDWVIKGRATYLQWQRVYEDLPRVVPLGEPRAWTAAPFAKDERWVAAELVLRTWALSAPVRAPSPAKALEPKRQGGHP